MTVKMAGRWTSPLRSRDQFFEIFDGVFALGVAAVTVHGRTVRQGYEGARRGTSSAK